MIRSRGSAARSATVRIGVGVSCQLVLVLPPPGRALAARAGDQAVVLADQLLEIGEELLLGRPAAVDADVRGAPQLAHPGLPPHLRALRPRLQQRQQRDPARPVVASRGRAAAASGRCSPPRPAPRPAAPRSRPPGERLASCSAASHSAIASAVTSPAELPCPSLLCRYSVSLELHERGEVELRAAVGRCRCG